MVSFVPPTNALAARWAAPTSGRCCSRWAPSPIRRCSNFGSGSAKSEFAKLTATGLTIIIGFQAFFIIGGVVRILPLTGITLPFVSYGGSALVANYILIALLMRISDEGNQLVDAAEQEKYESVQARRRALVAGPDAVGTGRRQ